MGSRNIYEDGSDHMQNNSEHDKMFHQAASAAGLSTGQKRKFSEKLHEEKDFQGGDWSYSELLALAREVKSNYPNL